MWKSIKCRVLGHQFKNYKVKYAPYESITIGKPNEPRWQFCYRCKDYYKEGKRERQ